jgi:hypothetical protein
VLKKRLSVKYRVMKSLELDRAALLPIGLSILEVSPNRTRVAIVVVGGLTSCLVPVTAGHGALKSKYHSSQPRPSSRDGRKKTGVTKKVLFLLLNF